MQTLGINKSRAFLGNHPVISKRVLLTSGDTEATLVAGSVIGTKNAEGAVTTGLFDDASMTVVGILAEDVTVPASGDAWAVVYVHCCAVAAGLVWGEEISATEQGNAIEAMRTLGIFVE